MGRSLRNLYKAAVPYKQIAKQYLAGQSVRELAAEFNVATAIIYRSLRVTDTPRRNRGPMKGLKRAPRALRPAHEERGLAIRALARLGWPVSRIALAFGMESAFVSNVVSSPQQVAAVMPPPPKPGDLPVGQS